MLQFKSILLYILALLVLLAPAIILGWIGLTLLGWVGLIIGIVGGLIIFSFSVNKIAAQDEAEAEAETETETEVDGDAEAGTGAIHPATPAPAQDLTATRQDKR